MLDGQRRSLAVWTDGNVDERVEIGWSEIYVRGIVLRPHGDTRVARSRRGLSAGRGTRKQEHQ